MNVKSEKNGNKLKMRKLVDKWNPSVMQLFLTFKLYQSLKIKPKEDGWRRAARIGYRTEQAKFGLSIFRLNLWSNVGSKKEKTLENTKKHIITRLLLFFKQHPAPQWKIQWSRLVTRIENKKFIDIVHAEYNDDGSLEFIKPHLDPDQNLLQINSEIKQTLNQDIVRIYNKTKDIKDEKRPLILKKQLHRCLSGKWKGTETYIEA